MKDCPSCLYKPPCVLCTYEGYNEHIYHDNRHKILNRSQAINRQHKAPTNSQVTLRIPLGGKSKRATKTRIMKMQRETFKEMKKQNAWTKKMERKKK